MKVIVWGARGSIPVSGKEYLKYGGDTTCLEIQTDEGKSVIIDGGTGIRRLGNRLIKQENRKIHLLLTHAHWDHLMGIPFFKPLYQKSFTLKIYGCTYAQESVKSFLSETMHPPFFPVDLSQVAAKLIFDNCIEKFSIGDLHIKRYPLNHPNYGYGYYISNGKKTLAFFPDNELSFLHPGGKKFTDYVAFFKGVDLLIHDAEYLPEEYNRFARGWGHSVYLDTINLAIKAEVKNLLFWHHDPERSDEEEDKMVKDAQRIIKEAGQKISCQAAYPGLVIDL